MTRRRRLILTRKIAGLARDPLNDRAVHWNPAGASLDQAWEALGLSGGVLAVIGGTEPRQPSLPPRRPAVVSRDTPCHGRGVAGPTWLKARPCADSRRQGRSHHGDLATVDLAAEISTVRDNLWISLSLRKSVTIRHESVFIHRDIAFHSHAVRRCFRGRPAYEVPPAWRIQLRAAARPPYFYFQRSAVCGNGAPQRRSRELGPAPTATTSKSPPMIDKFFSASVRLLLNASPDISQK